MVVTLKGDPKTGIMRRSTYEIYALEPGKRTPQQRKIKEGEATKSISEDLDEGKYVYRIAKELQEGGGDYAIYVGAFYVGLAEGHDFCELREGVGKNKKGEEVTISPMDNACPVCEPVWKKLLSARPQFSKGRQTTTGVRYACGFVGCRTDNISSALAMVKHEAEHQGIDILKNPDRIAEALVGGEEVARAQTAAKRAAQVPSASAR